jgi:hypothetical protein
MTMEGDSGVFTAAKLLFTAAAVGAVALAYYNYYTNTSKRKPVVADGAAAAAAPHPSQRAPWQGGLETNDSNAQRTCPHDSPSG